MDASAQTATTSSARTPAESQASAGALRPCSSPCGVAFASDSPRVNPRAPGFEVVSFFGFVWRSCSRLPHVCGRCLPLHALHDDMTASNCSGRSLSDVFGRQVADFLDGRDRDAGATTEFASAGFIMAPVIDGASEVVGAISGRAIPCGTVAGRAKPM